MCKQKLSSSLNILLVFAALSLFILSCTIKVETSDEKNEKISENEKLFIFTLQKHLDAVSSKDIASLKSTLSPSGKMNLILPNSEITNSTEEFIKFHEDWFEDTTWTFETNILDTEIGDKIGIAVTEIIYREPNRDGKPYFNRMFVSYGLIKLNGNWYVIQDHASSVEKSQ